MEEYRQSCIVVVGPSLWIKIAAQHKKLKGIKIYGHHLIYDVNKHLTGVINSLIPEQVQTDRWLMENRSNPKFICAIPTLRAFLSSCKRPTQLQHYFPLYIAAYALKKRNHITCTKLRTMIQFWFWNTAVLLLCPQRGYTEYKFGSWVEYHLYYLLRKSTDVFLTVLSQYIYILGFN